MPSLFNNKKKLSGKKGELNADKVQVMTTKRFNARRLFNSRISTSGNSEDDNDITLSPLQSRFVQEFVKDYCGKQAAIRCGIDEVQAGSRASSLLRKANVRNAIDGYEKNLETRFLYTKERILKEMSLLAFSDVSDYLMPDGTMRSNNLKLLPPQVSRAIRKVKIKSKIIDGNAVWQDVEFELHDKKGMLEKMGMEIGMFKQVSELTGANGSPLIPSATRIVFDFGTNQKEEQ